MLASLAVLLLMLVLGTRHVPIEPWDWVVIPNHYHFSVKFVFDRLSVPLAILSFMLSGTIGAFASRYMHRDAGYNRFFVLYALFVLGMVVTSLAGTIETLFAGWELVGLSSALLVAFFQERQGPARNGLWVWVIYRVSDAALLLAAVVMHHLRGEGDFDKLLGTGLMAGDQSRRSTAGQALVVGLLLLVAAAGKSALVPFSGWLPRAMEGPTPSSAVFYGALSVHLGAFLLLRVSPLLDASPLLSALVVVLGLDHRAVRLPRGQRADRHQVGPLVRVADAGGDHRRRDRPGVPVHRPDSPARPRLPADAPVRAGADAASRLPHDRERHRRAPAARVGFVGPVEPSLSRLALSLRPRARLPRRPAVGFRRGPLRRALFAGSTRSSGAGPTFSTGGRRANRRRSSPTSERSKSCYEGPGSALARAGDRHHPDRLALDQPGARAQPGGPPGPGLHRRWPSRSPFWRGWNSTLASGSPGAIAAWSASSRFGRRCFSSTS